MPGKKKSGKVKFIRVRGKVVPIKQKSGASSGKRPKKKRDPLKSLRNDRVTDPNTFGTRKARNRKEIRQEGKMFAANLGVRDTISRAVFFKTKESRGVFSRGAKAQLRSEAKDSARSKKQLGFVTGASIGVAAFSKRFRAGAIGIGALSAVLGFGAQASKRSKNRAAKNFDRNVLESEKDFSNLHRKRRKKK